MLEVIYYVVFFFQAEDGIRDDLVTGVQTCALPIFLLQFLYALQGSVARVESFVFATELRRVTEALRAREYAGALRDLADEVHDWSGGTRIGACLESFNAGRGRLVDRRTAVVILSAG